MLAIAETIDLLKEFVGSANYVLLVQK